MHQPLLQQLRDGDAERWLGKPRSSTDRSLLQQWAQADVRFVSSTPELGARYRQAVRELMTCIRPAGGAQILNEGGVYLGCWIESTASIGAELLSRFMPDVSAATFLAFAQHQRDDGLLPYKHTASGPAFAQIQIVTPFARSVWTHYVSNGRDRAFLRRMYDAIVRNDEWLARWRDTRGTGGVEAFCAYDTGHDLSPRFWHVPDSPYRNDPKAFSPDNPILPFVAPDLTANVACQRVYLARMAAELGEPAETWTHRAERSLAALMTQCHDSADGFFYDRDGTGQLVRVQSDVLLRVLACEIGDDAFFDQALRRYLLNTSKFFAKYPFTSIALDDPRFDRAFDYNSWAGPTNLLSLVRAPHAFEHHGRHVELAFAMQPALAALFRADRFAQTLDPFTGRPGFTEAYSPAILCLLDFVERLSGILPRPDGTLWFTGLLPQQVEHRDQVHETAYGRTVDGRRFELVNSGGTSTALCDGEVLFTLPQGIRAVTDRQGELRGLIGMQPGTIRGRIAVGDRQLDFAIAGNEQLDLEGEQFVSVRQPGVIAPTY